MNPYREEVNNSLNLYSFLSDGGEAGGKRRKGRREESRGEMRLRPDEDE